jgi:hypothetical protein
MKNNHVNEGAVKSSSFEKNIQLFLPVVFHRNHTPRSQKVFLGEKSFQHLLRSYLYPQLVSNDIF